MESLPNPHCQMGTPPSRSDAPTKVGTSFFQFPKPFRRKPFVLLFLRGERLRLCLPLGEHQVLVNFREVVKGVTEVRMKRERRRKERKKPEKAAL